VTDSAETTGNKDLRWKPLSQSNRNQQSNSEPTLSSSLADSASAPKNTFSQPKSDTNPMNNIKSYSKQKYQNTNNSQTSNHKNEKKKENTKIVKKNLQSRSLSEVSTPFWWPKNPSAPLIKGVLNSSANLNLLRFGTTHHLRSDDCAPGSRLLDRRNLFFNVMHHEIKILAEWLSPTPREEEFRRQIVYHLSHVISLFWPSARVELIGSFNTGLCLPTSDIDIVLIDDTGNIPPLYPLAEHIQKYTNSHIKILSGAKVPIIKYTDCFTGFKVDISINVTNGVRNTKLINRNLARYKEIRPLTMVLKYFLHQHNLNQTFYGGLGSYALVLLVQHYCIENKATDNLGELLLGFLERYGINFDYYTTGIHFKSDGGTFSKEKRGWYDIWQPFLLSIEDPDDPDNDVGSNSFDIERVKEKFKEAYYDLIDLPGNRDNPYSRSILSRIFIINDDLIRRQYM
jgi:non-canonical poly(A) RNA polymerase PAPD5/7